MFCLFALFFAIKVAKGEVCTLIFFNNATQNPRSMVFIAKAYPFASFCILNFRCVFFRFFRSWEAMNLTSSVYHEDTSEFQRHLKFLVLLLFHSMTCLILFCHRTWQVVAPVFLSVVSIMVSKKPCQRRLFYQNVIPHRWIFVRVFPRIKRHFPACEHSHLWRP